MSTNRESTVAWIKSGFNAGHQDILDDMVAKETTLHRQESLEATDEESSSNYPEIGETGSYSSTSSASRYAEPFLEERKRVQFRVNTLRQAKRNKENNTNQRNEEEEEPPINILVFDGGGMKVVSTCALVDEIEKISSELGYGEDWVSRFDLIAGSSAGGICSILAANTTSTKDMVELGQGLINEMATKAFAKLNVVNIFKDCQGLDKENQFDNVVMDFLKEDIPAKNDDGLKSFALCAARKTNDPEAKIKPFLLRTYDLPEDVEGKVMAGSSNFTVPKAIHSTSALPGIVRRFKTYHEKEPISLADGGFISVAPLAEAIMEAKILYPTRKIGVVVSIGLDSSNDRSSYQAIDIARINNPNIHFHRIIPEEALEGHAPTDSDLDKYAELTAKTKKFIRDSPREQLLLSMTLKKLFQGPSRRPITGVKRGSYYEAPKVQGILKQKIDLRASRAALKVGLQGLHYGPQVNSDKSMNAISEEDNEIQEADEVTSENTISNTVTADLSGSRRSVFVTDAELPPSAIEYNYCMPFSKRFVTDLMGSAIGKAIKLPVIGNAVNSFVIHKASSSGGERPYPYTCKSDYIAYSSLIDKTYSSRHLEACSQDFLDSLPPLENVRTLFERVDLGNGECLQKFSPKSTYLFPTFAQFLVDSFIVTKVKSAEPGKEVEFEWSKTNSPHDIGLCNLYGVSDGQTKQLRLCSNRDGEKGRLKSQLINGEEWPEFMLEENGDIKAEFDKLEYPQGLKHVCGHVPEQRAKQLRKNIFAFGGPRNNLNPNVTALATLMLREHNRHASEIELNNPEWDDERVFQITRNLVTVLYLKVILEDYIGEHITAHDVTPRVDPNEKIWNAKWYKPNWMTAEFSILYRLHALIPDTIHWGDKDYSIMEQLFNNNLLLDESNMGGDLRKAFVNISNHRATAFTLKNTEKTYMASRDLRAVEMGRAVKLKPYVDYCEYMGEPRPKCFADITSDESIQQALCDVYGTVDKVEFMVGLMAADHGSDSIWGMTMKKFIALDAFSQVFTHPLISKHVWARGEEAFTKYGFELIKSGPYRLKDIVEANTKSGEKLDEFIGMNNPAYVKESIFKGFCKT